MGTGERTRRAGVAARHEDRAKAILAATRELFDSRGLRDVQIEDVSNATGLNRAIIYRHFSGKEQLFALALESYLNEINEEFSAIADQGAPRERVEQLADTFLDYCLRFPAFQDLALNLLNKPGRELLSEIGEAGMFRMGRAVAESLNYSVAVLREGNESGEWHVEDPDYIANAIYVQTLGIAHLARVGAGIRLLPTGTPWFFPISSDDVRASNRNMVRAMLPVASQTAETVA